MKKVIIISLIMVLLSSSLVLAQSERKGTIMGTLGVGVASRTTVEQETLGSVIFDLKLINKTGLALSYTDVTVFSPAGTSRYIMPGAGYDYIKDKWYVGVMVHIAPMAGDLLIAGKINGGYFFANNIGLSGILMYSRAAGLMSYDFSMFNFFAGVTLRNE